jgi:hypothetical protein
MELQYAASVHKMPAFAEGQLHICLATMFTEIKGVRSSSSV